LFNPILIYIAAKGILFFFYEKLLLLSVYARVIIAHPAGKISLGRFPKDTCKCKRMIKIQELRLSCFSVTASILLAMITKQIECTSKSNKDISLHKATVNFPIIIEKQKVMFIRAFQFFNLADGSIRNRRSTNMIYDEDPMVRASKKIYHPECKWSGAEYKYTIHSPDPSVSISQKIGIICGICIQVLLENMAV